MKTGEHTRDQLRGKHVTLRPTPKAKARTKNRLREHGEGGFVVRGWSTGASCLEHRPALLLESVSKTSAGGESWHGWLPREEIEIEVLNESR